MLMNPTLINIHQVTPDYFTVPTYRAVFEGVTELSKVHDVITLPLLKSVIPNQELYPLVREFWQEAKDEFNIDAGNVPFWMGNLTRAYREREVDKVLAQYEAGEINPADLADHISEANKERINLTRPRTMTMRDLTTMYFNYMQNPDSQSKISTGYRSLDQLLVGGFAKQELSIVSARPSVGKTAVTLNLSTNMARQETAVGYFSGETGFMGLMHRIVASEMNLDMVKLQTPSIVSTDEEVFMKFANHAQTLADMKISVHDSGGWNVYEIRRQIIEDMKLHGAENYVAIIDHLGKITPHTNHSRHDLNVGEITFALKRIAQELDIHIVLLSQLNRNTEQRQDKRPTLADLRNSGDIEQDADVVIFLYRDDYYDKETEDANTMEMIVAKSRNSGLGHIKVTYRKEYQKILEQYEQANYSPPA